MDRAGDIKAAFLNNYLAFFFFFFLVKVFDY